MATESGSGGRKLVLDEATLRLHLAEIKAERARLDARERAILGALDLFENGLGEVEHGDSKPDERDAAPSISQREMIRTVLAAAGTPEAELSVSEIIASIAERFGTDLPRTSVSPTLAKMEASGEVEHVGRKWRLSGEGLFDRELTPAR